MYLLVFIFVCLLVLDCMHNNNNSFDTFTLYLRIWWNMGSAVYLCIGFVHGVVLCFLCFVYCFVHLEGVCKGCGKEKTTDTMNEIETVWSRGNQFAHNLLTHLQFFWRLSRARNYCRRWINVFTICHWTQYYQSIFATDTQYSAFSMSFCVSMVSPYLVLLSSRYLCFVSFPLCLADTIQSIQSIRYNCKCHLWHAEQP